MSYINSDIFIECEDDESICQKCGHDNQNDITQCEICGKYFCELCMSESGSLCKSCDNEY